MTSIGRRLNKPTVAVIHPTDLGEDHLRAWSQILDESPELISPFLSPIYTHAVSQIVPHVLVGVLKDGDEPVAFLPFARSSAKIGKRLPLCDYQGLISKPGLAVDIVRFIKGCGLRAWDFDHLLASQTDLKPFHRKIDESPIMNLSKGYAHYLEERRAAGKLELIKRCGTKLRKLAREVGALRLVIHTQDPAILRQTLAWRLARYDSRHSPEMLLGILEILMSRQTPDFSGTLSALYAGEEIVAAHIGLRSRRVWHWWFPAYNPGFEKYSPGLTMILKMAEHAGEAGVEIIDFGKGDMDYKRQLMNDSIPIAEGSVEVSRSLGALRTLRRGAARWLAGKRRLSGIASAIVRIGKKT